MEPNSVPDALENFVERQWWFDIAGVIIALVAVVVFLAVL